MTSKTLIAALALGLAFAGPVAAQGGLSQLQLNTERTLITYGYTDVDVTDLNKAQLAQIQHLAGSNKGHGDIRGSIGAVLGNSIIDFLRG